MTFGGSDIVMWEAPLYVTPNIAQFSVIYTEQIFFFGAETFERISVTLLLRLLGSKCCILNFQLTVISGHILVFS